MSDAADDGNWLLGWLLASGLWWAVLLKRDELLALVSVGTAADTGPAGGLRRLRGVTRSMGDAVGEATGSARSKRFQLRDARSQATRQGARKALDQRADQRDQHQRRQAAALVERDSHLRAELQHLQDAPALASARTKVWVHERVA